MITCSNFDFKQKAFISLFGICVVKLKDLFLLYITRPLFLILWIHNNYFCIIIHFDKDYPNIICKFNLNLVLIYYGKVFK